MQMLRKKTMTATIALVLMLTIAATGLACLPTVNAAVVEVPTFAFLTVVPSPVGVGQTVLVTMWLDQVPTTAVSGYVKGNWENFKLTITKPSGTTETKVFPYSDAVGSTWTAYVPDTVGTYYFQFSFPGQWINLTTARGGLPPGNYYYKPSTSAKVALVVQQEPIAEWPTYPLPTDYWDRPIESENKGWWQISGDWLMSAYNVSLVHFGAFNAYTKAPNSPHIVWTKPLGFGGITGGVFGDIGYYEGAAYEMKFDPPVIIGGKLYYNVIPGSSVNQFGFACVDIRTGEQLWWKNGTTITLGQTLDFESPNQHGVIPYLWKLGATYQMFDAFTGNWILSLINARTGTVVFSPRGDMLVYILDPLNNWLAMWNSTRAVPSGTTISWRPSSGTYDWRKGVQWNKTIPDVPGMQSIHTVSSDLILAWTGSLTTRGNNITYVAYSRNTGVELWRKNVTVPTLTTAYGSANEIMSDGVFQRFDQTKLQWYGYDSYSGNQIWVTEPYTNSWGFYTEMAYHAYGHFYTHGYDGMVHCYDLKTGELLWEYSTGNSGFETPYGTYPMALGPYGFAVADGKVFAPTGEHSPSKPLSRGYRLHAIDAETGEGVWSILGYMMRPVIADGYMVIFNGYDNQIYCFGKGKTATTVSAPQTTVAKGSSVLIQGTVLDQSPGAEGTPAVSDKSMEQWMEYLYMQHPCPANATGVPVKLQAFKADGTVTDIATVTSDVYGKFKSVWTPPDEGLYTIMATFAGSESYWTSYDATGLSVGPAPPAEPEPVEIPAYPDYTPLFAGIAAIGIVAIVLVIYDIITVRKLRK